MSGFDVSEPSSSVVSDSTVTAPARDFYDPTVGLITDEWQIDFKDLKFEKEIGSGSFGRGILWFSC
jgi:hypothetical protein